MLTQDPTNQTALLAIVLTFALALPVLIILLILFGAPFTTHHPETALCAAHMALLAAFPLFYAHGLSAAAWAEVARVLLPFDEVWGATTGTLLGAWLGAVPIPLDWDRDWQRWPVTIVTGAYLGCCVGKYVGEYVLRGRRLENDSDVRPKPLGSLGPIF